MNMSNVSGKRVTVITEVFAQDLERKVNKFLVEHKNVWNIQYQHTGDINNGFKHSVLIIYDN